MEHCIYDTSNIQSLEHPIVYEYSGISQTLPLHSIGPLKKSTTQIHVVLNGRGTLSINNKLYKISKGGIFILPADTYFFYQADSVEPWSYVWFGFSCDTYMLEKIVANSPFQTAFSFSANQMSIEKLYHLVLTALNIEGDTFSDGLKRNATLLELISVLTSISDSQFTIPNSELTIDPIAKAAMSYLFAHYFEDISIPEVAAHCHVDQSYLNRIFKKQYNLTLKRALILIRLNQAVQHLLYSPLSIVDIVHEVGFNSQIVFNPSFKQHFNLSPTEFRNKSLVYENNRFDYTQDDIFKLLQEKPSMPQAT